MKSSPDLGITRSIFLFSSAVIRFTIFTSYIYQRKISSSTQYLSYLQQEVGNMLRIRLFIHQSGGELCNDYWVGTKL